MQTKSPKTAFLCVLLFAVGAYIYLMRMKWSQHNHMHHQPKILHCNDINLTSNGQYIPKIIKWTKGLFVPELFWHFNKWNNAFFDKINPILAPTGPLCEKNVDILFAIVSHPDNVLLRQSIRDTWGGVREYSGKHFRYVFIIANAPSATQAKLVKENKLFNDIVQFNHTEQDAYLTYKLVLTLRITLQMCPQASYLGRATDDIVFSFRKLMLELDSMKKNVYFGCGVTRVNSRTIAPHFGLYLNAPKINVHPWPHGIFPKFIAGYLVMLSRDVVEDMMFLACRGPLLFPDDVLVAVWAEMLGVPVSGDIDTYCIHPTVPRGLYGAYKVSNKSIASFKDNSSKVFIYHIGVSSVTPMKMRQFWIATKESSLEPLPRSMLHLW